MIFKQIDLFYKFTYFEKDFFDVVTNMYICIFYNFLHVINSLTYKISN